MKQIKSNGKNLLMFSYSTHDYMDMYPEQIFRTMESKEMMEKFIHHMKTNWCSGTVTMGKEITPEEYFEARQSDYWKGCEEGLDNLACDCTEDWVSAYNKLLATLE